jgi:hypothetical protein
MMCSSCLNFTVFVWGIRKIGLETICRPAQIPTSKDLADNTPLKQSFKFYKIFFCKESMLKKRKDFETDFDRVTASASESDDYNALVSFIKKCATYEMQEFVEKSHAFIRDKMTLIETTCGNILSKSYNNDDDLTHVNLKEALKIFSTSFKLKNLFGPTSLGISEIHQRIEAEFVKKLDKIGDELERFEYTAANLKAFDAWSLVLEFKESGGNFFDEKEDIFKKISARTSSFLVKVTEFIRSKQQIFTESLGKLDLVETRASMDSMKKIVPFLTRLINEQQWYNKVKDQINEGKIKKTFPINFKRSSY